MFFVGGGFSVVVSRDRTFEREAVPPSPRLDVAIPHERAKQLLALRPYLVPEAREKAERVERDAGPLASTRRSGDI